MKSAIEFVGFDWDSANEHKNMIKHGVSRVEAEQVFFNTPTLIVDDKNHGGKEQRFHIYGKTDDGRLLHVTFTFRNGDARVISARNMHKKERIFYENNT